MHICTKFVPEQCSRIWKAVDVKLYDRLVIVHSVF